MAIRSTTEEEGKRTCEALHQIYKQVSNESKGLFQQNASEAQQLLERATGRQLTIGTLVAFLQYGSRFLRPIQEISERYGVFQTSIVSAEKVFALLDTPLPVVPIGDAMISSATATRRAFPVFTSTALK